VLSKVYGGEARKKSSVLEWHIWFKESLHVKITLTNTVLITFFNIKGIVRFEFIPQGQKVSRAYYVEILKQLYGTVCRKRLEFLPSN
jgi:hypothetical protein